jgi:thiamine-phosphate pyrophosphorylase
MPRPIGRFHLITDTVLQSRHGHAELARMAIEGGADTIQYRSKNDDIREMIAEASAVRAVCARAGVTFLVNDRVDLCLAVEADGVHLGRGDMPLEIARRILGPGRIIGGTVRNEAHLAEAVAAGADYVGLGPIFGTSSKVVGMEPLGLDVVRTVCASAPIPVIGIAGITSASLESVLAAGAHGVAVIGAVCLADDVTAAAREIAEVILRR